MRRRTRAWASIVSAVVVGGATLPLLPGAVAQEVEIRTDPGELGGYTSKAEASPFSILFFEQSIPIPTDPGEPQMEASTSYTRTTLQTGPTSRATASSTWPGPAFGDGFSTICSCEEDWFVRANASYPAPPHEDDQAAPGTGSGMHAEALGLDVLATAVSSQSPNPENAGYGSVSSLSLSTVPEDEAVTVTSMDAAAEDVALMGGVITIDSVRTQMTARSDGVTGTTTGHTEVNGLTIAGQGYVVDEEGARPVQDEEPGDGPPPVENPAQQDIREALGIEVILTAHEETVNGADAAREAGGLIIVVDTTVMKEALTGPVPINDVIANLPPDIYVALLGFLGLGPEIHYVFGRGSVRAAATEPFELPPLPPPPAAPVDPPAPVPPATGVSNPPPPQTGVFQPPVAAPAEPAPQVAPPPTGGGEPQVLAAIPAGSGIPSTTYVLWLALVALAAYALPYLTDRAMGGMTSPFCERGAPKRVPDLRVPADG
ncbi:MAG: hypothetical protein KY469_13730 [Actinobacteria bacterium]|nr:hypothetical protein [Actinomycetota bacterium]